MIYSKNETYSVCDAIMYGIVNILWSDNFVRLRITYRVPFVMLDFFSQYMYMYIQ